MRRRCAARRARRRITCSGRGSSQSLVPGSRRSYGWNERQQAALLRCSRLRTVGEPIRDLRHQLMRALAQANTFETFGKLFGLGRDAGKRMFNAIRAMCSWGGLSDTPRCDTRALLTSTEKGKEFAERFDKLGRKWEGDQIKLASPCACLRMHAHTRMHAPFFLPSHAGRTSSSARAAMRQSPGSS